MCLWYESYESMQTRLIPSPYQCRQLNPEITITNFLQISASGYSPTQVETENPIISFLCKVVPITQLVLGGVPFGDRATSATKKRAKHIGMLAFVAC